MIIQPASQCTWEACIPRSYSLGDRTITVLVVLRNLSFFHCLNLPTRTEVSTPSSLSTNRIVSLADTAKRMLHIIIDDRLFSF
jgi:hypothetical protein